MFLNPFTSVHFAVGVVISLIALAVAVSYGLRSTRFGVLLLFAALSIAAGTLTSSSHIVVSARNMSGYVKSVPTADRAELIGCLDQSWQYGPVTYSDLWGCEHKVSVLKAAHREAELAMEESMAQRRALSTPAAATR